MGVANGHMTVGGQGGGGAGWERRGGKGGGGGGGGGKERGGPAGAGGAGRPATLGPSSSPFWDHQARNSGPVWPVVSRLVQPVTWARHARPV